MVAFDLLVQQKNDEVSNKSSNSDVNSNSLQASPKRYPDTSPRLAHIRDVQGNSCPCSVPQFPCSE